MASRVVTVLLQVSGAAISIFSPKDKVGLAGVTPAPAFRSLCHSGPLHLVLEGKGNHKPLPGKGANFSPWVLVAALVLLVPAAIISVIVLWKSSGQEDTLAGKGDDLQTAGKPIPYGQSPDPRVDAQVHAARQPLRSGRAIGRYERPLQWQSGVFPIHQPTGVPPDVPVAAFCQCSIERDTR